MMLFKKSAHSLESFVKPISRIAILAGRGVLAVMVLLITLDVVLRYFFNRPIPGSYELVEFMMVVLVYLGLAHTQIEKDHISIKLLTNKLSRETVAIMSSATYLLCLGIFALITWRCTVEALALQVEGTASGVLFIPNFPFMMVVAFGSALLCLVFLIDVFNSLHSVVQHCKKPWLWLSLDSLLVLLVFTFPVWGAALSFDISRPFMGLIGIVLLIVLLFSSMPIGPVMALIGFVGFAYLVNIDASFSMLGTSPFTTASNQPLSTIPLFVLMGLLCFHSELSADIYSTVRHWMGRMPGGLAMTTVGACAGFAAVSGSSLATAVTMGTISLPEMKRYKYADSLACGSVAAGGSIGILIPPSVPFIIYASLTEESIGRLFMAGVVPGLMEAVFYMLTIYFLCKFKPELGPPGPSSTFREKVGSLKGTWGIIVLFILVIGGIYTGICTPTEAAGVGASGALLLGLLKRKLNRKKLLICLADACKNTAMLLLMLIGADIFGYFLTMSQIPFILSDFVVSLPFPSAVTVMAILFVYIILGCIMPIIPAIILTVPIFFPVVTGLGYSPIWFGVLVVTMAEIGQVTPPVGINVFTLSGVAKGVPLETIFKGIFPFLIADVLRVLLIFFIPGLALFLPSLMH
jgi:tripartite ATP-independent transporter DctM subunit